GARREQVRGERIRALFQAFSTLRALLHDAEGRELAPVEERVAELVRERHAQRRELPTPGADVGGGVGAPLVIPPGDTVDGLAAEIGEERRDAEPPHRLADRGDRLLALSQRATHTPRELFCLGGDVRRERRRGEVCYGLGWGWEVDERGQRGAV